MSLSLPARWKHDFDLQAVGSLRRSIATGTRYQQVLETIPDADPSKRQDMALMLAEVLAGVGKYPQAVARVDDALKIGEGWRKTDPLWKSHAYAVPPNRGGARADCCGQRGLAGSGIANPQNSGPGDASRPERRAGRIGFETADRSPGLDRACH